MSLIQRSRPTAEYHQCDVALVGAGVMSATLAVMLSVLDPGLKLMVFERLPKAGEESSDPWNNAGTGHAGMCELNYAPERPDGSVDVAKAATINEQFQLSRELWAYLVEAGIVADPETFIAPTAHMSFVTGAGGVAYMRARYEALRANPLFSSMRHSQDPDQIAQWAPLLVEGRDRSEPMAATHDPEGTDVNFGSLTKQCLAWVQSRGGALHYNRAVVGLKRDEDGSWLLHTEHSGGGAPQVIRAKRVFIGAGGYSLSVLQKAGVPEARGYGLFPISGQFLTTNSPQIVAAHRAKVYGQAKVGAPPMSVPHLDARVIDGERWVLFGPFAGQSVKFMKNGSVIDGVRALRGHNIKPMLQVAKDNLDLVRYLLQQIVLPPDKQLAELRTFYPLAQMGDWHMTTAGQRAQIIKNKDGHGALEFGTETIFAAEDTMAAVLGASPGASTAVPIILAVLQRCFPDRIEGWRPALAEMIPTWGTTLGKHPDLARTTRAHTAEVLHIAAPTG